MSFIIEDAVSLSLSPSWDSLVLIFVFRIIKSYLYLFFSLILVYEAILFSFGTSTRVCSTVISSSPFFFFVLVSKDVLGSKTLITCLLITRDYLFNLFRVCVSLSLGRPEFRLLVVFIVVERLIFSREIFEGSSIG